MPLSLILLVSILGQSCAFIAYDCSRSSINKTTISTIDNPDCLSAFEEPKVEDVTLVLTQNSDQEQISAYRCLIKANHIIKRCGKFGGDDQVVGMYSQVVDIGRESCINLVENNILRLSMAPDTVIELNGMGQHFKTIITHGSESRDGECDGGGSLLVDGLTYERAVRITSLDITYAKINALVDYELKVMIFPIGVRCELEKTKCEHGDYGYLYWDVPVPTCESKVGNQAVIYQGKAQLIKAPETNYSYVQLSHSGFDFQIKIRDKVAYICGFRSHFTEHPRLYVTFLNANSGPFPKLKKVSAEDVNMLNYINSKIVYSMRHTKNEVERLFRLFEKDRCQSQNKIIRTMLSEAVRSPVDFAFTYFHEPGHTAVVKGEAVHVAKCTPVNVTPKSPPFNTCYNEMQVEYNNKTMFMTPRSRILIQTGRRVDCSAELGPMYKINGKWVTQTAQGLMQVKEPEIINVDPINYKFESLESLANGGLYSDETIESYQKILTEPIEETIISSRVVSAMRGTAELPEDLDLINGFSEEGLNKLGEKVVSKMEGFFQPLFSLGQWFSMFLMIGFFIKLITGTVSYFVNFSYLKDSNSLFTSLIVGLFDVATFHLLTRKKGKEHQAHDISRMCSIQAEAQPMTIEME